MINQLTPISPPFPHDVAKILEGYPSTDGYILALFRTFANSVRFLKKAVPNLLDKDSPLDVRTRELTILRTTANRGCEYEWGVHVAVFSKAAKLGPEQIAATAIRDVRVWEEADSVLLSVVDQLCETSRLDERTLREFQAHWNKAQQLEILALVGTYTTISLVANVAELPAEPFAARFPDPQI